MQVKTWWLGAAAALLLVVAILAEVAFGSSPPATPSYADARKGHLLAAAPVFGVVMHENRPGGGEITIGGGIPLGRHSHIELLDVSLVGAHDVRLLGARLLGPGAARIGLLGSPSPWWFSSTNHHGWSIAVDLWAFGEDHPRVRGVRVVYSRKGVAYHETLPWGVRVCVRDCPSD